jgi:hypothetical protein
MSTIKVNKIENTATADGGIAIDASGHVTVDGQQLPTAGALSSRRININGAMQVAQRGTVVNAGNEYAGPDRFLFAKNDGAFTISQSTDVPSGQGFSNSWKADCTSVSGTSGSNYVILQHKFEGQDLQHLKKGSSNAESVTLQFWIKTSKTGTYIAELFDSDNNRQISKSYTVSSADTWEHKTITFPGDTSGALDNDNAESLVLSLWLFAGSSYTSGTLSTTWTSLADADRAVGQVNAGDSTTNNIYITGVQLEVGEKATPFEHKSFSQELNDCLRYFEKSYNYGTAPGTVTDVGMIALRKSSTESTIYDINLMYTHKRAAPTVVLYSPGSGSSGKAEVEAADETAQGSDIGENNARVTGTSQGSGQYIRVHYTADAEL